MTEKAPRCDVRFPALTEDDARLSEVLRLSLVEGLSIRAIFSSTNSSV